MRLCYGVVYMDRGFYRRYGSEWLTRTCAGVWHGEPREFQLRGTVSGRNRQIRRLQLAPQCVCESSGCAWSKLEVLRQEVDRYCATSGIQWKTVCVSVSVRVHVCVSGLVHRTLEM